MNGKKMVVLNIPDEYEYMDETLIRLLEHRVGQFLKRSFRQQP